MQFYIQNMVCDGCARSVTKAIQSADPAAKVVADPPNHLVDVTSSLSQEKIEAALTKAGFPPQTAVRN